MSVKARQGRDPADTEAAKIWQKNREIAKRIHEKFVEKYRTAAWAVKAIGEQEGEGSGGRV